MYNTPMDAPDDFIHELAEREEMDRLIDLRRRYDIEYFHRPLAPLSERWEAVDWNTFDPVGESPVSQCRGVGPDSHSALLDLLEQIAEVAVQEAQP